MNRNNFQITYGIRRGGKGQKRNGGVGKRERRENHIGKEEGERKKKWGARERKRDETTQG